MVKIPEEINYEAPLPKGPIVLMYPPDVPDIGRWVVVNYTSRSGILRAIGRVVATKVNKVSMVITLVDKTAVLHQGSCWHYLIAPEKEALEFLEDTVDLLRIRASFAPTEGAKRRVLAAIQALS
jgi:hypothetical protein